MAYLSEYSTPDADIGRRCEFLVGGQLHTGVIDYCTNTRLFVKMTSDLDGCRYEAWVNEDGFRVLT